MKFNHKKIFTWLTLASTLAVTSCRDDTFADYWGDDSDEYTVTINVGLEGMGYSTKADGEDNPIKPVLRNIGDGSKIDMLVYAVYFDDSTEEEKEKIDHVPNWQAVTEYAKGILDQDKFTDLKVTPGHGQTIAYAGETLMKGNMEKHPITLTLKKGEKYKVVFWAQNQSTEAFVIDDLKRVQMKYKIADAVPDEEAGKDEDGNDIMKDKILSTNNDEYRDAFCRSIDLDGNVANREVTIYLRRPLAQINVGTRGFDYESITRNMQDQDGGHGQYLYSKIRINRAARYLNVVEDRVYTSTTQDGEGAYDRDNNDPEAFYTIDYDYQMLPAYWRMENESGEFDHPDFPSYTIYDAADSESFNAFINTHKAWFDANKQEGEDEAACFKRIYEKEEFLKVHLYEHSDSENEKVGEDGYLPYASMGASMNKDNADAQNRTEEFKYLSMCYILTNSDDDVQDVLTNVKVWMAKDKNGKDEVEVINLNNVPVQRNHRTNIVGSLLTAEANMMIKVDQDFAGRNIHGGVQSGEIVEGFYYDAEKKEFQISSVNGLLFFQQLVNGDLTVRQVSQNNPFKGTVGSPYPYYDPNSTSSNPSTLYLKYKSWTRSDLEALGAGKAAIIMEGSGYNTLKGNSYKESSAGTEWTFNVEPNSSNNNWPTYNNFPFYNATVKLMADLDLSGIEWIPIGFDCANWDTTFGNYSNSYKGYYKDGDVTINYIALTTPDGKKVIDLGKRRAFCGTFDGNGHTIYNLTTKKFGGNVNLQALQDYGNGANNSYSNQGGPYDNVQWFQKGFFGVVGPGAVIKDLRLQEVDIQGNNGVGAIVGQVSSLGFPAKIMNCIVDRGVIDAVPIYRGDFVPTNLEGRKNARGCYIGGIVGQFCAKDNPNKNDESGLAEITGCEVRNLTIQGYRRMGGIVGSIGDQGKKEMANSDIQLDIKIENNSVVNSTLIVNQYRAFNLYWDYMGTEEGDNDNVWMNGFGWGSGNEYVPMTDNILGGYYDENERASFPEVEEGDKYANYDAFTYGNYTTKVYKNRDSYLSYVNSSNSVSNLQYTELAVTPDDANVQNGDKKAHHRQSIIQNVPMNKIPVFSSIFVDEVQLHNNYYGETNLHTRLKFYEVPIWVNYNGGYNNLTNEFWLPINFPNRYDIEADESSPLTGMYVESVDINGEYNVPSKRSVITPAGVNEVGACVMYVTARDRKQFFINTKPAAAADTEAIKDYKDATKISNVVLRGSPYAWAGIILAPNENMSEVELNNVTIYDVYKTLALQTVATSLNHQTLQNYTYWNLYKNENGKIEKLTGEASGKAEVKLTLKNGCNLRGFTDPGKDWTLISYNETTFEQGAETKYSYDTMKNADGTENEHRNEYKTCDVAAKTEFNGCYFKAPFYINLRPLRNLNDPKITVTFDKNCYGASAYDNVRIFNVKDVEDYYNTRSVSDKYGKDKKVYFIGIEKDIEAGHTVVNYYGYDDEGKPFVMYVQSGTDYPEYFKNL